MHVQELLGRNMMAVDSTDSRNTGVSGISRIVCAVCASYHMSSEIHAVHVDILLKYLISSFLAKKSGEMNR
jgi:hypothetical protein